MLSGSVPKDAIQFESSLDRLLSTAPTEDDQMFDYGLQQAYRALVYAAVDTQPRYTLPIRLLSPLPSEATAKSGVMGREAVWFSMCLQATVSKALYQSLVYLSTKMLINTATRYGEGNEVPCASKEWSIALLSYGLSARHAAIKTKVFELAELSHRKYTLGHLLLSIGTLRALVSGGTGKFVFQHYCQLGESWIELLLPKVALLADARDSHLTPAIGSEGRLDQQGESHPDAVLSHARPSTLIVEANHFIVHSAYYLATDILAAHVERGTESIHGVLDRDPPQRMWTVVDIFCRALHRSSRWVEMEALDWQLHFSNPSADDSTRQMKPRQHGAANPFAVVDVKLLGQVQQHVDEIFSSLVRQQEELHCLRERVKEQYGESAKDFTHVTELMWTNTLRLCFAMKCVSEAYIRAVGGVGIQSASLKDVPFRFSTQAILEYIGSCVAQIPDLESNPEEDQQNSPHREGQEFTAQLLLLAVATTIGYAAPLRAMQYHFWSADVNLTKNIQQVLSHRGLRARQPRVVLLASQIMRSIWTISVDSSKAFDFLASSSEQLLDMLGDSRDAASHCVVELISRAAVDRPHHFVPSLFRLLDHGSRPARQNAMDVLAALPQLETEALDESTGNQLNSGAMIPHTFAEKHRKLLRVLAEHLLIHLHDEELCIRLQSAQLFSKVVPEDVVGPLINLCLQTDSTGKRYASAMKALSAVVEAHTSSCSIIMHLIQHCSSVLLTTTEAAGNADVEEGAKKNAAGAPPSVSPPNAVPQSPGEVFLHAVLHSSEPLNGASGKTQEQLDNKLKDKAARVHTLFQQVSQRWVAGVVSWDAGACLVPLLSLAQPDESDALSESEGVRQLKLLKQQWMAKWILGVLCAVSALDKPEATLAVIRAVCRPFCLDEAVIYEPEESVLPSAVPHRQSQWLKNWRQLVEMTAVECQEKIFSLSFPLLCVRRCATYWHLSEVKLDEIEQCNGEADRHELLKGLWESMWLALTHPAYYPCGLKVPEFNALEIEILQQFSPRYFFTRWKDAYQTALTISEGSATAAGTLDSLRFLCVQYTTRAVVQRGSLILSQPLSSAPSVTERERIYAGDRDIEAWIAMPFGVLHEVILPWMCTLDEESSPNIESSSSVPPPPSSREKMQKLVVVMCELLAALMMFGITFARVLSVCYRPSNECIASSASAEGDRADSCPSPPATQGVPCWWCHVGPVVLDPFRELERFYRSDCPVEVNGLLERFMLAVNVHEGFLQHYQVNPLSVPFFLSYLPLVIVPSMDAANASAHAYQRRKASDCEAAVACGGLIFKALMATSKVTTEMVEEYQRQSQAQTLHPTDIVTSLSQSSKAASDIETRMAEGEWTEGPIIELKGKREAADLAGLPPAKTVVELLGPSMVLPLYGFALGCLRFTKSYHLQDVGVKLFSALLGIAPDTILWMEAEVQVTLQNVTTALQSIIRLHPTAATRRVAEQVVQFLPQCSDSLPL